MTWAFIIPISKTCVCVRTRVWVCAHARVCVCVCVCSPLWRATDVTHIH